MVKEDKKIDFESSLKELENIVAIVVFLQTIGFHPMLKKYILTDFPCQLLKLFFQKFLLES